MRRLSPIVLAVLLFISLMPMSIPAKAAAKSNVTVISKIDYSHTNLGITEKVSSKLAYKKGLITKFAGFHTKYKLAYNKKNQIKKLIEKSNDETKKESL